MFLKSGRRLNKATKNMTAEGFTNMGPDDEAIVR
jgi:hypothetical protein